MTTLADAEAALKTGDVKASLAALTAAVRAAPADPKLRTFMFQLLCIRGEWDRATTQLDVVAEMDKAAIVMKQVYADPVGCERLRAAVFAGKKAPMVFGLPEQWLALLIEALLVAGAGDHERAATLREQALALAPAIGGEIDGKRFEWLADADSRLGPVLEAIINNRYYWVPLENLSKIDIEPPEDLRDSVWMPVHLEFTNGGETLALIPTRYVGSEASDNGLIQLARETHWIEQPNGTVTGLGQRLFATDTEDYALMDIRCVKFDERVSDAEGGDAESVSSEPSDS